MHITLTRFTAILLLLILWPFVVVIRIYNFLTGKGKKPVYVSTIEGDPIAYAGDRPLVVAIWEMWSPVWRQCGEGIMADLKKEYEGRCEFAYVESARPNVRKVCDTYNVEVLPAILVFHHGKEVARYINATRGDEIRQFLDTLLH